MNNLLLRFKMLLPKYKNERIILNRGFCLSDEYSKLKIIK